MATWDAEHIARVKHKAETGDGLGPFWRGMMIEALDQLAVSLSPAAGTEALRESLDAIAVLTDISGPKRSSAPFLRQCLGQIEALVAEARKALSQSPAPQAAAAPAPPTGQSGVEALREPHCDECGREIILDCIVPSEVWYEIATREETLCPVCIDRRLAAKGYGEGNGKSQVEARFSFNGNTRSLFNLEQGEPRVVSTSPAVGSERAAPVAGRDGWWIEPTWVQASYDEGAGAFLVLNGDYSGGGEVFRRTDGFAAFWRGREIAKGLPSLNEAKAALLAHVRPKNSVPRASAVAQIVAWLDMASAPKDGTHILLWWPYWFTKAVVGHWFDGGWWAEGALTGGVQPIAWQPLPPPPRGEWQGTPVPSPWQPWATAPKDGSKFDVWYAHHDAPIPMPAHRVTDVYWSDVQDGFCTDGAYGPTEPQPLALYPQPTHWMVPVSSPAASKEQKP